MPGSTPFTWPGAQRARRTLPAAHRFLYVLHGEWSRGGQFSSSRLGDDVIVLDSDSDALLGDVDPGLDGQNHSRLEGPGSLARVVHFQPQEVARPVGEVLEIAGRLQDLLRPLVDDFDRRARPYQGSRLRLGV